jgi:diketogulonate reductase-like aldo/keto reductase
MDSPPSSRRKRKLRSASSSSTTAAQTAKIIIDVDNEDELLLDVGTRSGENKETAMKSVTATIFHDKITVADANKLTDGIKLLSTHSSNKSKSSISSIILPFIGYGTYKLKKETVRDNTLEAIRQGYRCIDTAFIYGGETTEKQVGLAIEDAIDDEGVLTNGRQDLVVITKHWRKYHGYDKTNECLRLSLKRLQLDYIDLWLMHWPGPAWTTMNRRKDLIAKHGPWHYAVHSKDELPEIRAETYRAMEDAVKSGKVKSIGVCNFTVKHLETLKKTATIWPPAVNQIECHPLNFFAQKELVEYCKKEGIVIQAYSSLGGQDAGKNFWRSLYPPSKRGEKKKKPLVTKLSNTPPVLELAEEINRTPAQVLLRWGLGKNFVLVPKTSSKERMIENAEALNFSLSSEQIERLENQLHHALSEAAKVEDKDIESMARLCWRNDPLRDLLFE